MAPLAVAVVVDRTRALAFRALRRGALGARQPHVHRAAGHIEVHSVHRPRRRDPQDRRVQLAVPHRLRLLCRRGGGTIAGGPSAGHATHTKPGRAINSPGGPSSARAAAPRCALPMPPDPAPGSAKPRPASGAAASTYAWARAVLAPYGRCAVPMPPDPAPGSAKPRPASGAAAST